MPREEDEQGCAEVRDPARHEQRRIGHVTRVHPACAKEIAGVVKCHHHHDQAAQEIDEIKPRPRRRGDETGRQSTRGRGPRKVRVVKQ